MCLAIAGWLRHPDFPLDDAYILQHAVNGLAAGQDNRFSGSNAIDGATSPAHLMAVALLASIMPVAWAQFCVGSLALVLYAVGVFRLSRAADLAPALAALMSALAVMSGLTVYQALNGLETGLAMAAVTWALLLFWQPLPQSRASFLLLGALPFLRPELAALSAILGLRALYHALKDGRARQVLPIAGLFVLAGALPFVLFLLFNSGSLWPGTASAKAYFFAEGCAPALEKFIVTSKGLFYFIVNAGPLALGFFALAASRLRLAAVSFIGAFLAAYFLRLPGALSHNQFRYAYLLLPFAVAGCIAAVGRLQSGRARLLVLGTLVPLAAILLPGTLLLFADDIEKSRTELKSVSEWVAKNVPPDAMVMVHDAGYISLLGSQPLVDLVGLKTPSSVKINERFRWSACARRDPHAIDAVARQSAASHFVVNTEWDEIFGLTSALTAHGWMATRVDAARPQSLYRVYRIAPPD